MAAKREFTAETQRKTGRDHAPAVEVQPDAGHILHRGIPSYPPLDALFEVTVDDPKAYTRPWTVKVNQRVMLDTELIEFICEERDAIHYVGGAKQ